MAGAVVRATQHRHLVHTLGLPWISFGSGRSVIFP